jgi:hypothetical protein
VAVRSPKWLTINKGTFFLLNNCSGDSGTNVESCNEQQNRIPIEMEAMKIAMKNAKKGH